MNNTLKNLISSTLITLLLIWIWPGGQPGPFVTAGVNRELIDLYEGASARVALPMPGLIFLVVFLCATWIPAAREVNLNRLVQFFGVYWVALGGLLAFLGGPFLTPDSGAYLRYADGPWNWFGLHHPSGTGWVLWIGSAWGFPISATVTALGALEAAIVQRFISRRGGTLFALISAIGILLHPELLIIRLSLWSEPMMLLGIVVTMMTLTMPTRRFRWVVLSLILLFVIMCEARHAALFLMPGFIVGTATLLVDGQVARWYKTSIGLFLAFVAVWLGANCLRTGNPTSPSQRSFECVHFIAAYHRMPFCQSSPSIALCGADPGNSFMKQGVGKAPGFVELDQFAHNPASPIKKLALSPAAECELWKEIRRDLIANHKIDTAKLLLGRILSQFGQWEFNERGGPVMNGITPDKIISLDQWSIWTSEHSWLLWTFWLGGLFYAIWSKQLTSPVVIFLVVGALGHAFGIAFNNPFLSMRYLAVHKYMLSLAALIVLAPCFGKKKLLRPLPTAPQTPADNQACSV